MRTRRKWCRRSFCTGVLAGPHIAGAACALLMLLGCTATRAPRDFRVLPDKPEYRLRAPDGEEAPFRDVPRRFTASTSAWVDLRPGMELRIESAYYREGSTKRGLADFLGTEVARYQVRPSGVLRVASVQSGVEQYPRDQPSIEALVRGRQSRRHRFFYEILLNRKAELRGAVLLSGASAAELDGLTAELLADPTSVCRPDSKRCSIFPESCTVSLEIEIVVNGAPQTVLWGSLLSSISPRVLGLKVHRPYRGHLVPVGFDASDPNALRLPLLPGDHISWE